MGTDCAEFNVFLRTPETHALMAARRTPARNSGGSSARRNAGSPDSGPRERSRPNASWSPAGRVASAPPSSASSYAPAPPAS